MKKITLTLEDEGVFYKSKALDIRVCAFNLNSVSNTPKGKKEITVTVSRKPFKGSKKFYLNARSVYDKDVVLLGCLMGNAHFWLREQLNIEGWGTMTTFYVKFS
jgi:hypothetical protein